MKRILLVLALVAISANLTIAQWTAQTSGVTGQLTSISAVDDNNAWMCAYGPAIIRTTNGGTTWTATTTPAGSTDMYQIFAIDANTALVTWSPGTAAGTYVARTTNAGATWTTVFNQPLATAFIDAIWMTSATNGFMYGDPPATGTVRWSLWKTTNGGVNWDSTGMFLSGTGEAGWNNALYVSGNNIWFGTNVAKIYYSSNGGTNWTAQTTPAVNSYSIWFNNTLNGLSGGTGNSYVTTNGGTAWTLGTMPGTANISGVTGQDNTWWTIRQANLIYKTTNNGTTWTTDYTNAVTTTIYNHIAKARTGNRIWACTSTGLISKNDGLVGIAPVSNEIPSSFGLEQNYPNPFNPTTTIRYSIPSASNVTVKIYDMLGNEVMTVVNAYQNAGTYAGPVDASKLASGVYFYTIKAGNFTDTKKMTLIK
jgi:photosystem II stability/assembly factor-like uncharacterized protein